jgi:hypothetical protein
MNKYIRFTKINIFILLATLIAIFTSFILDEMKIQELEDENASQQILIQNQDKLKQTQDSLRFECATKDIQIFRLKSIIQSNQTP